LSSSPDTKATRPRAIILGCGGPRLDADERRFFRDADPLGFILFARNLENPQQVKDLIADLHATMGREVPVLIDQEGGRVQRMKPPHWGNYPAAAEFEKPFLKNFKDGRDALAQSTAKMAGELSAHGFNVNCAPVLDVRYPTTHDAIGNRAFSSDPEVVAALGSTVCDAHLKKGVIPVIKHLPGQGRAASDSHKDLPVVEATRAEMKKSDFVPFRQLLTRAFSEAVWGMVAHVVYKDIDATAPSSCSRKVIHGVIRGDVGFTGLLLSDDIDMNALAMYGDAGARAEKALRAGCDVVLQCNGNLADMKSVAAKAPKMSADAVTRYNKSVAWVKRNFK
jgi:beta-N-acetylhexosaminidase